MKDKYGYSTNEEIFEGECGSRKEAMMICIEENGLEIGDTFWTAEYEEVDLTLYYPDAEKIIEDLQEGAYEEVGEVGCDFLDDITQDEKKSLDLALSYLVEGWLKTHELYPTFLKCKNVQEHTVTEDDLKDTK